MATKRQTSRATRAAVIVRAQLARIRTDQLGSNRHAKVWCGSNWIWCSATNRYSPVPNRSASCRIDRCDSQQQTLCCSGCSVIRWRPKDNSYPIARMYSDSSSYTRTIGRAIGVRTPERAISRRFFFPKQQQQTRSARKEMEMVFYAIDFALSLFSYFRYECHLARKRTPLGKGQDSTAQDRTEQNKTGAGNRSAHTLIIEPVRSQRLL